MKARKLSCSFDNTPIVLNTFAVGLCSVIINPQQVALRRMEEKKDVKTATFGGGCFWCTESEFEKTKGIIQVVPGYTGGHKDNPTYEEVSSGRTGHVESVQVVYDPNEITYKELLDKFWRTVDPTDAGGQFVDRGAQYKTAIFYHDEQQKELARESKEDLNQSGRFDKPIVTDIVAYEKFYPAENYHRNYSKKNPLRYKFYRNNSGRDHYLKKFWTS